MPNSRTLAGVWTAWIAALALLASACATFHMSEQEGPAPLAKQRRATQESAVVLPFRFAPSDPGRRGDMSEQDLLRWQEFLAQSLDQTDIFSRVSTAESAEAVQGARYAISGEIQNFRFRKNYVPTLFPVHAALSWLTFTAYTWLAGPTTITAVDFDVTVDVKDLRSGQTVGNFRKGFDSTDVENIYTSSMKNPYDNPGVVWADVIGSLASQIAGALPAEPTTNAAAVRPPEVPAPGVSPEGVDKSTPSPL